MSDEPTPRPGANQLAVASLIFYGLMSALGLGLIHLSGSDPWLVVFGDQLSVGRDALLGSLSGLGLVGGTWALRRWPPMVEMKTFMAETLGELNTGVIAVLAITSAVGEELLFRGAVQPLVGLPLASIAFGLMHGGLSPRFRTWVGFAIVAGLLLGALFSYTGNLLAPILCHLTVNYFNLHVITQESPTS